MTRRIGYICTGVLTVVLAGLAIHTPATIWIGSMLGDGLDVIIKAWKELLLLAIVPGLGWLSWRQAEVRCWLQTDRLVWLIVAYVAFHLVMLLVYWQGWWPSLAGLMIDLRYLVAFMVVFVVVLVYPGARQYLLRAVAVGAVIIIGFAIIQHFIPHDALKHIGYGPDTVVPYLTVDQNYDFIRFSSTMRGPNPLGAYAASVVLMVLALVSLSSRRREPRVAAGLGGFAVLASIALWYSYSRSAKLALVIGVMTLLAVIRPWQQIPRRLAVALTAATVAAGVVLLATLSQSTWFSNVVLHTNPEGGSVTQSNTEHWQSLVDGASRALSQPLGAGVGSTGSASLFGERPLIIENQYLFIAHEVGWLGLALFVGIFGMVLWRLYRQAPSDPWAAGVLASGLGLAAIGLVLPVWVDDVVSITWWSLAAIILATNTKSGIVNDDKIRYANKHKHKSKIKRNNSSMRNKLIVAALVLVGLATVAYAAFSQQLQISGTGTASGDWDVKITGIVRTNATGATDDPAPSFTGTSATFNTELAYPGATATYQVTVSNEGSIPAKLDAITDLATINSGAPAYIKYSVSGVTAGTTTLAAGATNTVDVTVTWDVNETQPTTTGESKTATINLDYSQDT